MASTTLNLPNVTVLSEVRSFTSGVKQMYIGGKFVDAIDGATFATVDPATGEEIVSVAEAREEDIDRAARAAHVAFSTWSTTPPSRRARLLFRLADLVDDHREELAQIESLDNGKPLGKAVGDIESAAEHFRYYAGWATKIEGATLPVSSPGFHVYTKREPIGVVGAIIPWNFPLSLASWKIAPALAAGCTVVLKPAEQTPLSALRLAELIDEAGLPPGVVNVCPGFGESAGAALVVHPLVDKIAFTGSVEVGKEIARRAAAYLKHVSLELGGKSPNIVFSDADIAAAGRIAADAGFTNSGQVCSSASRLMVDETVFDDVLQTVVEEAQRLVVGPGLAPDTTFGPLVSEEQHRRVMGYIDVGVREGANRVVGGGTGDVGFFVEPTVLTEVEDDATVCREEIFGPVIVVQPFCSIEEVASRANDSKYGLAAGVWTRDVRKAHTLAELLHVGTVWINCWGQFDAAVPFGGYKESGYGRDNGREALEKYLQTKSVWTNINF